nr:Proline-rich protein 12 [Haemonchus contortus]
MASKMCVNIVEVAICFFAVPSGLIFLQLNDPKQIDVVPFLYCCGHSTEENTLGRIYKLIKSTPRRLKPHDAKGERKMNVPSCFVQSASDFNTETVKARLSKFSQADGHLPKGTFVVCKADLFRDDCALWRVDNQNMIQKYPPRIDPATRDISYRNSSTYSGWCDQVAFGYYRIAIKHLKQTRSEAIIQPEIPITDLFPAMSFEYKDASGFVRGEALSGRKNV